MANTFNPEFPDEIQGATAWSANSGQTFDPEFPDQIQGATSWENNSGQTFNPEFPSSIQEGPVGQPFNPEFPEEVTTPAPSSGGPPVEINPDVTSPAFQGERFSADVDLDTDILAQVSQQLGLNENAIFEAINTGNELFRKVTEGYETPNIENTLERVGAEGYRGITKLVEKVDEESRQLPSYQATALQGRLSVPGVGLATSKIVEVVRALIGDRGERMEQANWILQGSALVANAVNTPERLLNSPLGRALKGQHHMAQRRMYWTRVGFQLGKNIEYNTKYNGITARTNLRFAAGARNRSGSPTGIPRLDIATISDEGNAIEELLNDESRWQNYAAQGEPDNERSEEARRRYLAFKKRRDEKMTKPGGDAAAGTKGEDSNLQELLFKNEVPQQGHYDGQQVTHLNQQAIEKGNIESNEAGNKTEAARLSMAEDSYGDISTQGEDFLKWASHRLRWGNGYTHLFEVTIEDAPQYRRLDSPPALRNNQVTKAQLDFSNASQAFKFACVGASVGGLDLTVERTGAGDLPLPTGASVAQDITLDILDYTRLSLYNYFYSWYLNFYNPHKRRWVSGKEGKYKNIFINVQAWYGDYWRDDNTGEDDSEGEGPPPPSDGTRASKYNNKYDTVLQIAAYNCIPVGFPGMKTSWEGSEPFQFQVNITPSDVYYNFRNPQNYTANSNRPHIAEVYSQQIAEGRMTPKDVRKIKLEALGLGEEQVK
ncbi:MAG: hypothetical protein LC687_05490 [Actinobacteria bacterium]|nr:hypothetical protein [Actinomycetota bacterium]